MTPSLAPGFIPCLCALVGHRQALDVRPRIEGKYRIKFKAEALPLKDEVGGYRILYSHNCQFGLSQTHQPDKNSMATLDRIFPSLGTQGRYGERAGPVIGGMCE